MFLYALMYLGIAVGLMQLGALSVWVSILSLALKSIVGLAIVAALYFALRPLRRRFKRTAFKNTEQ